MTTTKTTAPVAIVEATPAAAVESFLDQEPRRTVSIIEGYSSIRGNDKEAKKRVFNAVAAAEKVDDNLGKEINLVDILAQPRQKINEQTGNLDDFTSITLLDADGSAFNAGSKGLSNSIQTLVDVYGEPHTWEEPLKITIGSRKNARGTYFYVNVV